MMSIRIGDRVAFKPAAGLGGWRPGTVTGFVGKLVEVQGSSGGTYAVRRTHVREARQDEREDRGARQAAMREAARTEQLLPIPPETLPVRLQRARSVMPRPKATKPTRSQSYRKWCLMQPCAVTGKDAAEAHHYTSGVISRGISTKVSDLYCVPLSMEAHNEWHARAEVEQAKLEAHARGYTYGGLATRVRFLEAALKSLVTYVESKEGE